MPSGDVYSKGNRATGCAEANPSGLLHCCKILLFVKVLHADATEKHQNNQQVDQAPKTEVAQEDLDWQIIYRTVSSWHLWPSKKRYRDRLMTTIIHEHGVVGSAINL